MTEDERQAMRRKLQQALVELGSEVGWQGLSARSVAKRAGVSPATLYLYFENFNALLMSMWEHDLAQLNDQIERIAKDKPDPVRRLEAIAHGWIDFMCENEGFHKRVVLSVRPDNQPPPEPIPRKQTPIYNLICGALLEGQEMGRIRAGDVDEMAQVLWASIHGALSLALNIDEVVLDPARKLAESTVRFCIDAITLTDSSPG